MNRHQRISMAVVALAVLMSGGGPALADPAVSYRTVALSGQAAAGIDPGVSFAGFWNPLIDEFGRVSFPGYLTGPGITTGNDLGIWTNDIGGNTLAVREGSPAPGTESGTTFQLLPTYWYGFGPDGTHSFGAALQGPNVTSGTNTGIWSSQSGVLTRVAREGDQPPGFVSGSKFQFFDRPTASCNGTLAFGSGVYNPDYPDHGGQQNTLWSSRNGTLSTVARAGDAAPGSEPGMYFDTFSIHSAVTSQGDILFASSLSGPAVPYNGIQGIWFQSSSGMSLVARTYAPAPGPSSGFVYGTFLTNSFPVNASGQTAFIAQVAQPEAPYGWEIGLYAGGAGSMHYVVKEGDPAPGLPSGVKIDRFQYINNYIPIDDSGKIAIHAELSGTGVTSSNSDSIFQGTYDNLSLLVREGDPAPDTPAGVLFSAFPLEIQMNHLGQIAFSAGLRGPGIDSSNGGGIWAQDTNGVLHLMVQRGEPFEVAPGDFRTIQYLNYLGHEFGGSTYGRAFNDRGEITFQAIFTDGSNGVFVARVPEPSSLSLLIVSLSIPLIRSRSRGRATRQAKLIDSRKRET